MIFERQVGSDKNKHGSFSTELGSQGFFLLSQKLAARPPFSVICFDGEVL